ncbi:MAG: lysophospholipid acyltransferase family protein [Candidatus Binatia bacterium]
MARKRKQPVLRRFFYGLKYRVGEHALRGFVRVLPLFPAWFMLLYTRFMASVAFFLLSSYRKRMEENLAAVFGNDISAQQRKALVWAVWLSFARGVLDTTQVMYYSQDRILSTVALEGEEHIKRALEHGKGVLALSAHLGSFTMIGARLAAAGFPFSAVVKQPADERFARLIDSYRARIGIHTISAKPRREAVRGILKALRRNHIVLVIADEFKSGDVMVDFLGLKVPAPRGPATLALRTGAITLPMFVTRERDDSLRLSVGAPIAPVECGDIEASVVATTALYTRHIEAAVRKTPDQWNWLGLPRRGGEMSRAEIARQRRALRLKGGKAKIRPGQVGSGTSSS